MAYIILFIMLYMSYTLFIAAVIFTLELSFNLFANWRTRFINDGWSGAMCIYVSISISISIYLSIYIYI
jgi:hypothetical protein